MNRNLIRQAGLLALLGASGAAMSQIAVDVNRAALAQIEARSRIQAQAEKQEALRMAPLWGIPVQELRPNGQYLELMAIRNNRPVYFMTDNVAAARTTRTNLITPGGALGFNLTGNGIVIGQWDGGTGRTTHQELTGRIVLGDAEPLSGDHATHVGGTMIAKGIDPNARGMATKATIRSYGWNNDVAEMAAAAAGGVMISNHSYGYITGWSYLGTWYWYGDTTVSPVEDPGFGMYDPTAQAYDTVAYNAQLFLPVHSAGNDRNEGPASQPVSHKVWDSAQTKWVTSTAVRNLDGNGSGYDTIPYTATAKNMLTIGAVNDVPNYTGPGSVGMSSFSGWGPTDDGRIKPDIVGNGVGLYSSAGSADNAYVTYSGTSMASPNVAGSLALLLQQYPPLHKGLPMLSSTLRALAIHSASECGTDPGPDYKFGFGLLDMGVAAKLVKQDATFPEVISEHLMNPGATYQYYARADGNPLKATMAWTDPPGPVSAWVLDSPLLRLVNDLDMRVSKGATTYSPWVLNPAAPGAAATKGDNFRDNVEQIVINSPTVGTWYKLDVSHKGASLVGGGQLWSLVISGVDKVLKPIKLLFGPGKVIGSFPSNGTLTLNDVAPAGGLTLNLSSDSPKVIVPATVKVPAGATSVKFKVKTGPVTSTQIRKITASWYDISVVGKLTLEPGGLQIFDVTPKTLKGGTKTVATVTLSGPAGVNGQKVRMKSSWAKAVVPLYVTVPAGQSSITFDIPVGTTTRTRIVDLSARMGTNTIVKTITVNP